MKRMIFLLVISSYPAFLWAGEASPPIDCKVKAKLSSQGSVGEAIVEELRQTKTKLFMAIYGFNNLVLAEELVNLAKRDISVRMKLPAPRGGVSFRTTSTARNFCAVFPALAS